MDLPVGSALAAELGREFGLADVDGINLRRIFAAVQRNAPGGPVAVAEYMVRRFTGTLPPSWMSQFVQLPWAQIWTLNVDDCVERAYADTRYARQKPLSISWTERHRAPRHGLDEVLIVHLHGKAARAARDGELVFDISSYLHATQAQHRWHALFGDYYPTEPFLIIGASLDAEIDLQSILEQGRLRANSTPSIIVNRTITALQAEEYREFGLVSISATAQEFFDAVSLDLPDYLRELTSEESVTLTEIPQAAITFLGQWQELRGDPAHSVDPRHDVYAGHEPEWWDSLENRLAPRALENKVVADLERTTGLGESKVVAIRGGIFGGKTALLLNTGRALLNDGYRVFIHNGEAAPDHDAIIWWYQHYPKTVLLMDNAFDFSMDVRAVVDESEHAGVAPKFLLTDRHARAAASDRDLDTVRVENYVLSDRLSDSEIRGLLQKLTANRRLGDITGLGPRQQVQFFEKHGRQMFSAMAALERGRGFEARVREEYASVTSTEQRRLMGVVGLASSLGYGLPLTVAPRASGMSITEIERVIDAAGPLGDFLHLRRGYVVPRHRIFGTLLVDTCLSAADRFNVAVELGLALAPHVSPAAISAKTIHYLIARALMSNKFVSTLLERDNERTLELYSRLQDAYDWNARYWEQRALAASNAGLFEPAYSWARQAVQVRADSYTLNTVGTVLMRRALAEARTASWPAESFEAAEAALREARSLEQEKSEYPFETFFTYTVRLAESVPDRDRAVTEQLRQLWDQWYTQCLTLDSSAQGRIRPVLASVQPRWEQAVVTKQD